MKSTFVNFPKSLYDTTKLGFLGTKYFIQNPKTCTYNLYSTLTDPKKIKDNFKIIGDGIINYGKEFLQADGNKKEEMIADWVVPSCVLKGAPKIINSVGNNTIVKNVVKGVGKCSNGVGVSLKDILPNQKKFIEGACKFDRNSLSKVGRGLQKHSSRPGSAFNNIKFSHKNANKVGENILKDILNSKDQAIRKLPNGTTNIFDNITRRGVNISREGLFNGFRDLNN